MLSLLLGILLIATLRMSMVKSRQMIGVNIWQMFVQGCLAWIFMFLSSRALSW
jgi:hypothetical protein